MDEHVDMPQSITDCVSKEIDLKREALSRAHRMIRVLDEIPGENRKDEVSRTMKTLGNLVEVWKTYYRDNEINRHRPPSSDHNSGQTAQASE